MACCRLADAVVVVVVVVVVLPRLVESARPEEEDEVMIRLTTISSISFLKDRSEAGSADGDVPTTPPLFEVVLVPPAAEVDLSRPKDDAIALLI